MIAAAVAVWRRTADGIEWLVLHRSHFEAEFAGDWAWGPPGGGANEGETADECARRELVEETGLDTDVVATRCGEEASRLLGWDFVMFHAQVGAETKILLSWEHDTYSWLPLNEAQALCRPSYVGAQLVCVAKTIR